MKRLIAMILLLVMPCTLAAAERDAIEVYYAFESIAESYNLPAPQPFEGEMAILCNGWMGCIVSFHKAETSDEITAVYITADTATPDEFMIAVFVAASAAAGTVFNPFLTYLTLRATGEPQAWRLGDSWLYMMHYNDDGVLSFLAVPDGD